MATPGYEQNDLNPTGSYPPDLLIEEVRERRRAAVAASGGTLRSFYDAIQRLQRSHPEKLVDESVRRHRHGGPSTRPTPQ